MPIVDVDYRTLAAQLQAQIYDLMQERDQLKRRLTSTEAELNVAVDQLEHARAQLLHAQAERITDAEIERAYPSHNYELGGAFDG